MTKLPSTITFVTQAGTVTLNWQLLELPHPSVAVQVTVVTPILKVEPDGGVHTVVMGPGQLSETAGAG